jgi:hypothetical protein
MSLRRPRALVIFLLLGVGFAILFAVAFGVPELLVLDMRSRAAVGRVVSTAPEKHGSVTVEFSLPEGTFQWELAPYSQPVGESVQIYYDPRRPSRFVIENPAILLRSRFGFTLVCAELLSAFVLAARSARGRVPALGSAAFIASPRVAAALVSAGCVVGSASEMLLGPTTARSLVSDVLVLSGCFVLVRDAFAGRAGWAEALRSRTFLSGILLVVLGEVAHLVAA